jgi:hypothetical protein
MESELVSETLVLNPTRLIARENLTAFNGSQSFNSYIFVNLLLVAIDSFILLTPKDLKRKLQFLSNLLLCVQCHTFY